MVGEAHMKKDNSLWILGFIPLLIFVCSFFTGCVSDETKPVTKSTTSSRIVTTTTTTETPPQTTTTRQIDRSLNRGHSIREYLRGPEITRTSDVILRWEDALELLNDSVKLQNVSLEFRMYEKVLEKDSLDYQWYKFRPFYRSIPVHGADFKVICFYDGTLIEGNLDFTTCTFQPDYINILDKYEALEKYQAESGDDLTYYYEDFCYRYTGEKNECVRLTYEYRHVYRDERELSILSLVAKTGEYIGHYSFGE